jgi:hypothetical protein
MTSRPSDVATNRPLALSSTEIDELNCVSRFKRYSHQAADYLPPSVPSLFILELWQIEFGTMDTIATVTDVISLALFD